MFITEMRQICMRFPPRHFGYRIKKAQQNPPARGAGQRLPQAPKVPRPPVGPSRSPSGASGGKAASAVSFHSSADL